MYVRKKFGLYAALLTVGLLWLTSGSSHAGTISYSIATPNDTVSPYPGPYGQVDVTWSSGSANQATIKLTALSAGGFNYIFFDGSTLALNTNGAVSVVGGTGGLTATQPSNSFFVGVGAFKLASSGNADSFGSFSGLVIDTDDGPKNGMNSLSFTLQRTTGSWTSETDVLAPNAKGHRAAGHVAVFNSDYSSQPATGFAGDGSTGTNSVVPEPASLTLVFLGVSCLLGWRYRKERVTVAAV